MKWQLGVHARTREASSSLAAFGVTKTCKSMRQTWNYFCSSVEQDIYIYRQAVHVGTNAAGSFWGVRQLANKARKRCRLEEMEQMARRDKKQKRQSRHAVLELKKVQRCGWHVVQGAGKCKAAGREQECSLVAW